MMINRSIEQVYHKEHFTPGATIVEARNLSGKGFENVSMSVRAGEIVGLYGLIGAGRSEFVTTLYGRHRKSAGQILLGRQARFRSTPQHDAIKLGMALAPESRRDQGLCLNLPVGLNLNLPIYKRISNNLLISGAKEKAEADRQIADLRIKTPTRRCAGLQPVRRQSAEDRHRQMAGARRQAVHLRRADGRRRCRHQGRDLPAVRRAVCRRAPASS